MLNDLYQSKAGRGSGHTSINRSSMNIAADCREKLGQPTKGRTVQLVHPSPDIKWEVKYISASQLQPIQPSVFNRNRWSNSQHEAGNNWHYI